MEPSGSKQSASPPTERVLGIIELLARQRGEGMRLADVARTLGLSQSTAHAIVSALCERGWASRDPVDKTLSLGPALELAAAGADLARPRAHATRAAALELARELGLTASVTERTGGYLTLNFLGGAPADLPGERVGERIPFRAPFGPAFAAWDDAVEQQSWIERGMLARPELAARFSEFLDATRRRGFSVEYMAPTLARTARLFEPLGDDPWSKSMRHVIDEALRELATAGFKPERAREQAEVTAISAPVFDRHGRAVLNIGIHPFKPLAARVIEDIGARLTRATAAISASAELPQKR